MLNLKRRPLTADYDTEPKTEADKGLQAALQNKLAELVAAPMTARTLIELEQFASRARSLIIVGRAPGQQLDNGGGSAFTIGGITSYGLGDGYLADDALSPAPASETFGATAIRELVAAVGKMNEKKDSPQDTVRAIAAARDANLPELAARLEAKLLGQAEAAGQGADIEPPPAPDIIEHNPVPAAPPAPFAVIPPQPEVM